MSRKQTPFLFDNIYKTNIKNYQVLYNPFSSKGLFILNKKFNGVIGSINGISTIDDCFNQVKKKQPEITKKIFNNLIHELVKSDIINFKSNQNYYHIQSSHQFTLSRSLTFWINLTSQCNFRCSYCFVEKKTKKMSKQLVNLMIENIFLVAKKHNIQFIGINIAGGEPLLEIDLLKTLIIKFNSFKNSDQFKHIKTSVSIITNASLLTEELALFLKAHGVLVGISIDGVGKYHDYTRKFADGSGTYKYVSRGLAIAKKNKILSNAICTITPKNIDHLPYLVKFFQDQNINFTLHFYRKVSDSCQEQKIQYNKNLLSSYKKALKNIYSDYARKKHTRSPFYQARNKLLDTVILFNNVSKFSCTAGLSFFSINPDGSITACPSENGKIMASIKDKDFLTTVRKQQLKIMNSLNSENKSECRNCLWKYTCRNMCSLEKRFDKSIDKCMIMKKLIPYIIKLEASRVINMNLKMIQK